MKPQTGDTVHVHYTGTLSDGSKFDSSAGREPLAFTVGEGSVIPGFESAITDLEVGGTVTVTIPAAEAYGEHNAEALQQVPLAAFGEANVPQAGWVVQLEGPEGQPLHALIAAVDEENVTLDFNHPLAGKDLTFELELVEIVAK